MYFIYAQPSFDCLPPEFTTAPDDLHDILSRTFGKKTAHTMRLSVSQRLIATIVYHSAWLKNVLHPLDPIRQNYLFANPRTIRRLEGSVKLGAGAMQSTGVPPITYVLKELRELRAFKDQFFLRMEELIEEKFREHGEANGTITRSSLSTTLSELVGTIRDEVREEVQAQFGGLSLAANAAQRTNENETGAESPPGRWHFWPPSDNQIQGSWQRLPVGFHLPPLKIKAAFQLWLLGNEAQNIGPLSKIGTGYKESVTSAFSLESEERMFYRWKSVLNYFTDLAKSKWATEREEAFPITPSQDDVDSMWEMIKDDTGIPNKSPKGRTRNVAQLSITRADRLLKNLGLIDSNKRPRLSRPRSSRRVTRSNTSRMADVV